MPDPREPHLGQNVSGDETDFELAEPFDGEDDGDDPSGRRRKPRLLPMWILIGAAVIAGVAWAVSDRMGPSDGEKAGDFVPLITAEDEPIKVKPDDPGGLEVLNRDKYVYQSLDEKAPDAQPEQLLPPPEEPLDKPAPPNPADLGVVSVEPDLPPPSTLDLNTDGTAAPALVTTADKSEPKAVSSETVASAAPDKPAKAEPKPAVKQVSSVAKGPYVVQLASARDEARATKESQRLVKAHQDVLGNLNTMISRADLGDKGVWYRIRFGAFKEQAEARAACEVLKAKKVGCLVVKN